MTCQVEASTEVVELADCKESTELSFERNNIFDLDKPDTSFIHRWANALHIKTRASTLENDASFFSELCEPEQEDLEELERHLRSKKYLSDAQVSRSTDGDVIVKTWDTWSLTPTLSFGRKGGKNKFSIGIKDQNLLGLGVNTELRYFTNPQRKGYKVKLSTPLYFADHVDMGLVFSNNNGGQLKSVYLTKPFVSVNTESSFFVSTSSNAFTQSVFHNGRSDAQYKVEQNLASFDYGWLHRNTQDSVLRFTAGVSINKSLFFESSPNLTTEYLPSNRDYKSINLGFHYFTKQYKELNNTYLINQIEDVNLGWSFNGKLSVAPNCNLTAQICYPFYFRGSKGTQLDDSTLMFFGFSAEGVLNDKLYNSPSSPSRNRLQTWFSAELFHSFNASWRLYTKSETHFSSAPRKDAYVSIGGTSGVRGYAIGYQWGKSSTALSTELRYYPNVNIYKLVEVGAAVFADVGRTFGKPLTDNVNASWLSSVGVGLRLFSPHSSDKQVAHLDVIFPQTSGEKVNNYEFRISTKQTF